MLQERGWRKDGRQRVWRLCIAAVVEGKEVEGWKLVSTAPLL
jgi:hypothetical protein